MKEALKIKTKNLFSFLFRYLRNVEALQLYLLSENITSDYAPVFNTLLGGLEGRLRVFLLAALNIADQVHKTITANEYLDYVQIGQPDDNDNGVLSKRVSLNWVSEQMIVLGREWADIYSIDTKPVHAISSTLAKLKCVTYQLEQFDEMVIYAKKWTDFNDFSLTLDVTHATGLDKKCIEAFLKNCMDLTNPRLFHSAFEIVIRRIEDKPAVEVVLKLPKAWSLVGALRRQEENKEDFHYAVHLLKGSEPIKHADLLELMRDNKIDILQVDGLKYLDSMLKKIVISDAPDRLLKWFENVTIINVLVDDDEDDEDLTQCQILLDRISFICKKLELVFLQRKKQSDVIQLHPRFIKEDDAMPCCTKLGINKDTLPGGICLKIKKGTEMEQDAWLKAYWTAK